MSWHRWSSVLIRLYTYQVNAQEEKSKAQPCIRTIFLDQMGIGKEESMLVTYMKSDFGGTDVHRVVANVATAGGSGNSPTSDSRMAAWEISLFFQLISSENFHGSMNLPISLLEADPEETPSGTDGHQRKRSIARIDRSVWSSI